MGKPIATNKKAYRNFTISDKWECGIALAGSEVKSIRAGHVNFKDSFAKVDETQVFLYNLYIQPYKEASFMNEEPDRVRKLLLHKREIKKIRNAVIEKGFVLVPTSIYFNKRGIAKIELALGKSRKKFDKREDIKKRSIERALKRTIKVYKG